MKRALFLDRDGVINVDHAYVHRRQDFQFVEGIFELCRQAKSRGYLLFVVTNQAGIGRGLYSEADFADLTDWMCGEFAREGCALDKVYYCPTHAVHGIGRYKVESERRKPGPGMILEAVSEYAVDLTRSVLVGDKLSDIEAGVAAGVHHNILLWHRENPTPQKTGVDVVASLDEVQSILIALDGTSLPAPN